MTVRTLNHPEKTAIICVITQGIMTSKSNLILVRGVSDIS